MFVRKKVNKSGVISVQVIEKRLGKSILLKTVGSSSGLKEITSLVAAGKRFIAERTGQISFHFDKHNEAQLVDLQANLDEIRTHEKETKSLLVKAEKLKSGR